MQPDFSLSRKKLPRNILRKRLKNFHKKNALIRPEKTLGMSCGRGCVCVGGGLRGGRRRRVVAELLDGGVNRAAEAQRQGGGLSRSCGTAEGAGWQSGGRLGGKAATGRDGRQRWDGRVVGLWRGCGAVEGAGWQSGGRLGDKATTGRGGRRRWDGRVVGGGFLSTQGLKLSPKNPPNGG